jgi:thiamine-phosphate pyrophosphorylase
MRSLNPHIKINKLLDYSKEIKTKNNKLPRIIIIFDDNVFDKNKFAKLKIPKKTAFLLRSYKVKNRKKIAKDLLKFCKMKKMKLIIGLDLKLAKNINAHGIHIPEYMIKENRVNWIILEKLKLKKNWIITISAHNLQTLKKAEKNYNIDAALLSPIFSSQSHPTEKGMGTNKFSKIIKKTNLPIYALGGINIKNVKSLFETGIIGYAFQRGT